MKKLLYLVHRIPYPPNKGDKIRSFHWLKGLAETYDIFLGTFIDDENDWQYAERLNDYCIDINIERLEPTKAKLKSLKGMYTGEPLTIPYYASQSMQRWVNMIIERENIIDVLVFSSSMAQFVESDKYSHCHRVVDFVDMDSDKWMQYAEKKQWPMSWVYQRESKTLIEYERNIAEKFSKSLFVSDEEAQLFSQSVDDCSIKIDFVNNGVDTKYFNSEEIFPDPYNRKNIEDNIIVFTGAMDYWANVDAVKWFVEEIFPLVKEKIINLRFVIVGSKPTPEVINLQTIDGVSVTGFVEDVRPYLQHANIAVAPMRIARGIQNKVLEAMSMSKQVFVSAQGLEGIKAHVGKDLILCNTIQEWVKEVVAAFNRPDEIMQQKARACVVSHYSWQSNIIKLTNCFKE